MEPYAKNYSSFANFMTSEQMRETREDNKLKRKTYFKLTFESQEEFEAICDVMQNRNYKWGTISSMQILKKRDASRNGVVCGHIYNDGRYDKRLYCDTGLKYVVESKLVEEYYTLEQFKDSDFGLENE